VVGTAYDGSSAITYGSGGSGGASPGNNSGTAKSGGNGFAGVIIIRYNKTTNAVSSGFGGGGIGGTLTYLGASVGTQLNATFPKLQAGINGTKVKGGDGGFATASGRSRTNYGDGDDGNNGFGF